MAYIGKIPAAAALTSSDITDGIISTDKLANDAVVTSKITDGTIATADIANVNVTQGKIADQAINEAKMQISNAPTNGYMLTAQSGNTGGLTWAEAGSGSLVHITTTVVGSDTGYVNFNNCFTADYDVYRLHWSNFYNSSADNQRLVSYFMDTNGNHLGSGQYETVASLAYANSGADGDASGRDWGVNFLVHTNGSVHRGVASSGSIDISNPRDGSNRVSYNGQCFYHNGSHHYVSNYAGCLANSVEIFGINFTVTGGSIKADTTFSIYGYTKS